MEQWGAANRAFSSVWLSVFAVALDYPGPLTPGFIYPGLS